MTTKAYVLIETAIGKTKNVLKSLSQVDGVREADAVTGEYDVVAILEAENLEGIGELVTKSIHNMGGIVRTKTFVATLWHD